MIARTNRFHGLGSLRFAYSKGKTVRTADIGLRYIVNTRRTSWRAAVVVSKKVHKSAVKRNRIRRRIYEVLRGLPAITQPVDLIFTVYSADVITMSHTELQSRITRLLSDAEIVP